MITIIKNWPIDKQLSIFFPLTVTLACIFSGSILSFDPMNNKAALSGIGVFVVLVVIFRRLLNSGVLPERLGVFLYEFWPIPAALLGYLSMRLFHIEELVPYLGIPVQDGQFSQWDAYLFGQPVPLLLEPLTSDWLTFLTETAYLHFYYLLPIGSLIWLHLKREDEAFLVLRRNIVLVLFGGFTLYFFLPVQGPIVYLSQEFSHVIGDPDTVVYRAVESFRYKYDCFPSLHTAVPWVVIFSVYRFYPNWFKPVAIGMALSITFSTVYLRYHYGIDVMAGMLWAIFIAALNYYLRPNGKSLSLSCSK